MSMQRAPWGKKRFEQTFTLYIELGNDAMCEWAEVADAIESVAARIRRGDGGGRIKDTNGNTVGEFDLDDQEDER